MTKSPNVVFNSMFTFGFNNPDNVYTNKDKTIKRVMDMYKYYTDESKKAVSMFDYYTGKLNKENEMNLIVENGSYATKEEVEKRKKQAVKYLENSNLWQGVISFNNDYINKNIDIHKLEKEMATKVLPMFFKKCGFKESKNMFYQLSLHTDTDNLHFHFSFMEKQPNYITSKGKLNYRYRGELTDREMNFLKNQIAHTIEKENIYTDKVKEANIELDELKKYFNPEEKNFLLSDKKDLLLESKIYELGKRLDKLGKVKNGKIYYNSIKDKYSKQLVSEIKNYIFSNANGEFKKEYKKFKKTLRYINSYFGRLNKSNNISSNYTDNTLITSKEKRLDSYINNVIVNYSKSKLTENDFLKILIHQKYIKNKLYDKKKVLHNYLSKSKPLFNNRSEIEKSIKHINYELDKSSEKFKELFEEDLE